MTATVAHERTTPEPEPRLCCEEHGEQPACPYDGCPECFVDNYGTGECDTCDELRSLQYAREWPEAVGDPWCLFHGVPDPSKRGQCQECDRLVEHARRRGWQGPTGCDGEDCIHCNVCDRCKGTGTVCRWCGRCADHEEETSAECERIRWDRFVREERTYWEHSFFDKTTGQWS